MTPAGRFAAILRARPARSTALVYQAIILGLAVHIFILGVLYLMTAQPDGVQAAEAEPAVEEFDLQFVEPEQLEAEQLMAEQSVSEEVRNLLANAASQRTSERVNYTGKSKAEIEAEVMQNLKGMEAEEFERLKSGHEDFQVNEPQPDKGKSDQDKGKKDDYEWYKNQSEQSYQGPVSAEFDLAGRSARSTPRPTYRCKSSGKVVVRIQVDATGNVTDAQVDEALSTGNECIREESRSYALRWKFDYSASAPKKQDGTITFTFSAQ